MFRYLEALFFVLCVFSSDKFYPEVNILEILIIYIQEYSVLYILNIVQILIISDWYLKNINLRIQNNHVDFYLFVTGSPSAPVENTTNFYSPMKTQSKRSITLMLAIIGLTVVISIIIMMYMFTRLFEKCLVKNNTI